MKLRGAKTTGLFVHALALFLSLTLFAPLSPAQTNDEATSQKPGQLSPEIGNGLLIKQVPPTYPPLAKQGRIQGIVVLDAIIKKDGTVEKLRLLQGHPLLVPAAMEAVKQWQYKPYVLNGKPTKVETTVTVNFALADSQARTQTSTEPPKPQVASTPDSKIATSSGPGSASKPGVASGAGSGSGETGGPVYHVGSDVSAPKLIYSPDPEFPEENRQEGIVLLNIVVGTDGRAHNLRVEHSLNPSMDENAVEAVKNWRFEPSMKDGKAVMVDVNVQIHFHLRAHQ